MLVDLYTTERDLEGLMLEEYPGLLFDNQIGVMRLEQGKIYGFLGLNYKELTKFLTEFSGHKFVIIEHATERFIADDHNFNNLKYAS